VMPRHTPFVKVEQHALAWRRSGAARRYAQRGLRTCTEHHAARQLILVHPYDDPAVMAGQGTVAIEMLAAMPQLEMMVVPIGGGGLISGIAVASRELKPSLELIGVQTESYPSMPAALRGEELTAPAIRSPRHRGEVGWPAHAPGRARAGARYRIGERGGSGKWHWLAAQCRETVAEGAGAADWRPCWHSRSVIVDVTSGWCFPAATSIRACSPPSSCANWCAHSASSHCEFQYRINPVCFRASHSGGDNGGNILDVFHRRLSTNVPAKSATLELSFERAMRDTLKRWSPRSAPRVSIRRYCLRNSQARAVVQATRGCDSSSLEDLLRTQFRPASLAQ